MSFASSCQTYEEFPCLKSFGEVANHVESIARYLKSKVADRRGFILDMRDVVTMPLADEVFIQVLKYPFGCMGKIALVDLGENRSFCSLYERLVRTRGYQARCFTDLEMANRWLLNDDIPSKDRRTRYAFLTQGLMALTHCLSSLHLLHAANSR